MRDLVRRAFAFTRGRGAIPPPVLGFGSWDDLDGRVLAVCHPDWRGVRAAAYAFGDPVVEVSDAAGNADEIVTEAGARGVDTLVVHGFPPGADVLLLVARERGMGTRAVVHASMAQHGAEPGEASVMDGIVELSRAGVIERIGFVKEGLATAFSALGIDAVHTPNRAPDIGGVERRTLGDGMHVGVFAEPFWRKNVVTQLGAVAIMSATAHVMRRPDLSYLDGLPVVEHGELARGAFLDLQASTDLNLYVTLSESHPMGPLESYLSGVPALLSRTSAVFKDDPALWELATTDVADDPAGIASSATRLVANRDEAMERALNWIARADAEAAEVWAGFTRSL